MSCGMDDLWKIILVGKLRHMHLLADVPREVMVVCDIAHMVSVYDTEWNQPVSHDSEQSDQNIVDDIDDIVAACSEVDPADQKEHPCEAEQSDQRGIESDEEAQGPADILTKAFHATLESSPA